MHVMLFPAAKAASLEGIPLSTGTAALDSGGGLRLRWGRIQAVFTIYCISLAPVFRAWPTFSMVRKREDGR